MEFDEKSAKLQSKKVFVYDANGNITSETENTAKNVVISKLVHSYDATGKVIETTVWSAKKPPAKPAYLRKYIYALFP
jgi:antitoxin component YwqK of YwqJK toxin-antitoxin module